MGGIPPSNNKVIGPTAAQGAGNQTYPYDSLNIGNSTEQSPLQATNAAFNNAANAAYSAALKAGKSQADALAAGKAAGDAAGNTLATAQNAAFKSGAQTYTAPVTTPEASSGPAASGSSPTQTLPAIDPATAQLILNGILNGSGTPNILNSFQNVTYHFRFFCLNDLDIYSKAGGSFTSAADYFNAIIPDPNAPLGSSSTNSNGITSVIVAESGSTIYNITDVEFTALIGPNADTRNVNMTTISMSVIEPMGSSFLSALKAASDACGNYNFKNCFYYLELSFKGYDYQGNIVNTIFNNPPNIPAGCMQMQQGDRWIWEVQIVDIDISLDVGGGSYTLNLIYSEAAALDDEIHAIPDLVVADSSANGNCPDNSIGAYFANLGNALTQAWLDNHGVATVKYGDVTANIPAFKFFPLNLKNCSTSYPNVGTDPSKFTFLPPDPNAQPQQTKSTDIEDGYFNGVIQPGVTIERLIETALCHTQEGQALGLGGPANTQSQGTSTNPTESFVFRVVPSVIITGYNAYYGKYCLTVTFNIIPFYTQYPITTPTQVFTNSSTQAITNMVYKGLLQKKYNYMFTGQNTEVINMDISLNAKWNVQLPRFFGQMNTTQSVAAHKTIGTQVPNVASTNALAVATQAVNAPANANQIAVTAQLISQNENLLSDLNDANAAYQHTTTIDNTVGATSDQLAAAASAGSLALQQAAQNLITTYGTLIPQTINPNAPAATLDAQINANISALSGDQNQIGVTNGNGIIATENNRLNALTKAQNNSTEYTLPKGSVSYAQSLVVQPNGKATTFPITFAQGYRDSSDQTGTGFVTSTSPNPIMLGAVLNQMYDFSANPLMQIDLTVRGDPYWLGETNLAKTVYFRSDGVVPPPPESYQSPQVFGEMNMVLDFQVPYQESSNFTPTLSPDETYRGVYIVTQVKSSFIGGAFTQVLSGKRQPLITLLNTQGVTTSSLSDGSGDTSAVTSIATQDTGAGSAPALKPQPATSNNPSVKTLGQTITVTPSFDPDLA